MTQFPPDQWSDPRSSSQSNTIGLVGFILSFCLSPIGLILSLIGLGKSPRGFAIAGVIVGLIGTAVWAFVGYGIAILAKGFALAVDYQAIQQSVDRHKTANGGALPTDLAALGLSQDERTDPWGKEYRFTPSSDGVTWTLTSAAFDGQFDTKDDGVFANDLDQQAVGQAIEDMMKAHFEPGYQRRTPIGAPAPTEPAPASGEAPSESTPQSGDETPKNPE